MNVKRTSLQARGRPRSFDEEKALDAALEVFWRQGYEGASLSDLTGAMGINRPSLYAAFGNKEKLFRLALDRYAAGPAGYVAEALAAPTARAAVEGLLRGAIDVATKPCNPGGCLAVQGALACSGDAEPARRELAKRRSASEALVRERLRRARAEGDLPREANPADLARYVATVVYGICVQAAGGASRAELRRVADLALRTWPSSR